MLATQNVKMLLLSMEASRQIRNVWFTWGCISAKNNYDAENGENIYNCVSSCCDTIFKC